MSFCSIPLRSTLHALKDATNAVIPDSRMFYCEKCNKHVSRVFPMFCIKVRLMDHTDSGTFVKFDRDASVLFNMSCVAGAGGLPPQIADMVEKTWLFKVETKPSFNPRFEQSFRVRKICTEEAIINKFKVKRMVFKYFVADGKDVLVDGSTNVLS
ncbi:hypothetical protein P8452_43161 [Trifolium repens]|nr:hypothetical protein P8452_43161 [Trifolium repens]